MGARKAEIGAASLMHKRLAFVLQLLSDMKLKGLCPRHRLH
jgi:hypothetical protein